MDFRSLIDTFGRDLTIKSVSEGQYVNGIWQEGIETEETIFGVSLHLPFNDVQKLPSGEYTTEDRKLIVKDDVIVKIGYIFVEGDLEFEVRRELDQSFHGKIKTYVAKKVVG